jgi:hypothetical protein
MKRTNAWAVAATVGISALAIGSAIAVNSNMFSAVAKPSATTNTVAEDTLALAETTVPAIPPTIVRYEDVYVFETAGDPGVPISAPVAQGVVPLPAATVPELASGTASESQPSRQAKPNINAVTRNAPNESLANGPELANQQAAIEVTQNATTPALQTGSTVRQTRTTATPNPAATKPSGQHDNNEEGEGNDD